MFERLRKNVTSLWYGKLDELETDVNPVYDDQSSSDTYQNAYGTSVDESLFHYGKRLSEEETNVKRLLPERTENNVSNSSMLAMGYGVNIDSFTPDTEHATLIDKQKLTKVKKYCEHDRSSQKTKPNLPTSNVLNYNEVSVDPTDDVRLQNRHRNCKGGTSTSDYFSQISNECKEIEANTFLLLNDKTPPGLIHDDSDIGITDSDNEETHSKQLLNDDTHSEPIFSTHAIGYGVNPDTFTTTGENTTLLDTQALLTSSADQVTVAKNKMEKSPCNYNEHTPSHFKHQPYQPYFMMGLSDEDQELNPQPFQRNENARISNLYSWNSVTGVNEGHRGTPRENNRRRPINRQIESISIENATNTIFNLGEGESNFTAINSSETGNIKRKVKDQTRGVFEKTKQAGPFVNTEAYVATKNLITRKPFAILYGPGDGTTTILNRLLLELSGEEVENDDGDVEFSKANPYVIFDQSDWTAIEHEKPSVIVIHDVYGQFLNDILRRVKQTFMSCSNMKILVSMTKTDDNVPVSLEPFQEYFIDLRSEYLIERKTMHLVAENIIEKKNIKYRHGMTSVDRKSERKEIVDSDVKEIVRLANRGGFIKYFERFVENDLAEGPDYFKRPDLQTVQSIEALYRNKEPGFFALLALNEFGGEVSTDRVEMIRSNKISKRSRRIAGFQLFGKSVTSKKPPIPQDSFLMKYAKEMNMTAELADTLHRGLKQLNGTLLEEAKDVYRYSSGKVETSLLIVLAKTFPEDTLPLCEFSFIQRNVYPLLAKQEIHDDLYVAVECNKACRVKKALIKRFTDEILEDNIYSCCKHYLFQESWFVDDLLAYWKGNEHFPRNSHIKWKNLLWKILQQREKGLNPYCLLYFGQTQSFRFNTDENITNAADKILELAKWKAKRKPTSKWSEWVKNQEEAALNNAIKLDRKTTVYILTESGLELTDEMLHFAIQMKRAEIVKHFVLKDYFTKEDYWNAWLYAYDVLLSDDKSSGANSIFNALTEKLCNYKSGFKTQYPIHYAVSRNDSTMTKLLCKISESNLKVDVNETSEDGDTALNIAMKNGNKQIVELLICTGARQNNPGNVGKLPIHEAAELGKDEILVTLIAKEPLTLNMGDRDGNSPLHLACSYGHTIAVQRLLSFDHIEVDLLNTKKYTPLHLASMNGRADIVEMLILNGADVQIRDSHNQTALSLAGQNHHYECVETLLKEYTEKDYAQDSLILFRAIEEQNFELLDLLIEYNYSLNNNDDTYGFPLLIAFERDSHSAVEYLIQNGANINQIIDAKDDLTQNTIIHYAVEANKEALARGILSFPESAVLIDVKNQNGDTALHVLCRDGKNTNLLKLLLEKGFSTNIRNKQMEIPIRLLERRKDNAFKETNIAEWRTCSNLIKSIKFHL